MQAAGASAGIKIGTNDQQQDRWHRTGIGCVRREVVEWSRHGADRDAADLCLGRSKWLLSPVFTVAGLLACGVVRPDRYLLAAIAG